MSGPHPDPDAGVATAARDEWDRHWALYGEPAAGNPANAYRHRLVLRLLGPVRCPEDHIIDIGSGQGELARGLNRRFPAAAVAGVEYSAEGVERAQAAADGAGLAVGFTQRDLLRSAPPCSAPTAPPGPPTRCARRSSSTWTTPACSCATRPPISPPDASW